MQTTEFIFHLFCLLNRYGEEKESPRKSRVETWTQKSLGKNQRYFKIGCGRVGVVIAKEEQKKTGSLELEGKRLLYGLRTF